MRTKSVSRVVPATEMLPAVARVGVRRMRRRTAVDAPAVVWSAETPLGRLEVRPAMKQASLAGAPAGRVAVRLDGGTSTAECSSDVEPDVAQHLVDLVVSSVSDDVRRVAWFVPVDDGALERVLVAAGFACEGWAAPPVGELRAHQQWALLPGRALRSDSTA